MEISILELATIPFLLFVSVWVFTRNNDRRDRYFLGISAVIYVAVMGITFWSFMAANRTRSVLVGELLFETVGVVLVWCSRKMMKKKPRPDSNGSPIN